VRYPVIKLVRWQNISITESDHFWAKTVEMGKKDYLAFKARYSDIRSKQGLPSHWPVGTHQKSEVSVSNHLSEIIHDTGCNHSINPRQNPNGVSLIVFA
jgi:lysozyme family protein